MPLSDSQIDDIFDGKAPELSPQDRLFRRRLAATALASLAHIDQHPLTTARECWAFADALLATEDEDTSPLWDLEDEVSEPLETAEELERALRGAASDCLASEAGAQLVAAPLRDPYDPFPPFPAVPTRESRAITPVRPTPPAPVIDPATGLPAKRITIGQVWPAVVAAQPSRVEVEAQPEEASGMTEVEGGNAHVQGDRLPAGAVGGPL